MAIAMTSTATSSYIPSSSPSNSNKSKVKTKIIKEYHHDICVTYDALAPTSDSNFYDSDPEETQHLLSTMRLHSDRSCVTSMDTKSDRANRTKYSIGGISAVDSGVVSHDSLLDRYQAMSSNTRSDGSDSLSSPSSRYSTASRRSDSPVKGEFDPLNRTVLLDCKLRSSSKSRLEERQRGRSPCGTRGVKQMINFFEGSQDNVADSRSTTALRTSIDPPAIKQPLCTKPISPLRLARSRHSSKHKLGSPTAAPAESNEGSDNITPTRTKQESSLRLTCVASGYSKYSPNEGHKVQTDRGDGDSASVGSADPTCSKHKINGAISSLDDITANAQPIVNGGSGHVTNGVALSNGEHTTPAGDGGQISNMTPELNGNVDKTTSYLGNCSNNHMNGDSSPARIVSHEGVDVNVVDNEVEQTTLPMSNGIDQVDRSELSLPLREVSLPTQPSIESKLPTISVTETKVMNGVVLNDGIHDSPSKKNGDWFLKITDKAEKKLLSMCAVCEHYLEQQELSEEVSGQIRAATGKAHLLVNKKFKQFRELCNKNLTQGPDEPFPTTSQDLAGFWDLVYIQIENCETSFKDIDTLHSNGWVQQSKPISPELPRKATTPRGNKSIVGTNSESKGSKAKTSSSKPSGAAKARDEARKRLMAAKRAMKERRNSETDDVIFVSTS